MKTKEDLEIWNMVHNWCKGLQADIPDMARRHLIDLIESHRKKHSIEFLHEISIKYFGVKYSDEQAKKMHNEWINNKTK